MTTLDDLYEMVTKAIVDAEHAEGINARILWCAVSLLEEEIAAHPDADGVERGIGRRGAVEASMKAGLTGRAERLVSRIEAP